MNKIEREHQILAVVKMIPDGAVATYGQIAKLAGLPRNARLVGSIMSRLPRRSTVPWQRVVNSRGEISQRGNPDMEQYQREILEVEGIEFDRRNRVALARFGWQID